MLAVPTRISAGSRCHNAHPINTLTINTLFINTPGIF